MVKSEFNTVVVDVRVVMRESEADVVPTPPAFDAFAADEGDRDREGGCPLATAVVVPLLTRGRAGTVTTVLWGGGW